MRISTSVHRVLAAMLALTLALALTIPAFAVDGISARALAAVSFSDVPISHTFYKGVMYCAGKGIVNGYPDGTFKPTTTIAKNHFCAMLARAFYADQVANNDTDYYKKNYGTFGPTNYALAANGILNDSSFRRSYTNDSVMTTGINRYDMATLITNIMNQKGFAAVGGDPAAFVESLGRDKNVWVLGGGAILASLLDRDLVDHLIVQVAPVLLGEGIPLFTQKEALRRFRLEAVRQYGQFAELVYSKP